VSGAGNLAGRLLSAIEAASRTNALNTAPWTQAPTWTASTNYGYGQTVRGAVAGSTTNLYMCCGIPGTPSSNAGVSAASGGPTGVGPALITDGTCVWLYVGQAESTGTKPLYSTVVPAASTDVMNGYLTVVSRTVLSTIGLSQSYPLTATNSPVELFGCVLSDEKTPVPKNSNTALYPIRSSSVIKYVARFITNSKKWVALDTQAPLYRYGASIRAIKVNGRLLSESALLMYNDGSTALVSAGAWLLDVSGFPPGDKVIEVFGHGNVGDFARNIVVQADEFVYPYTPANNLKMALEGDSITDMTYLSDVDCRARMDWALGELLGIPSVYNNSIGGTGVLNNRPWSCTSATVVPGDGTNGAAVGQGKLTINSGFVVTSSSFGAGTTVIGTGVPAGTYVLSNISGSGNGSTWIVNNSFSVTAIAASGAASGTAFDRLADIAAFQPNILVLNGTHNDDAYAAALQTSEKLRYLQAARAQLGSSCMIVVVGGNLLQAESTTGSQLVAEQTLKAAFDAFAATDLNCAFIPVLTSFIPLINGNNGYLFQAGGSPSGYSNAHPISWYYYHMNNVIANGIRKFIRSKFSS